MGDASKIQMLASPRSATKNRISNKRVRSFGPDNAVKKLLRREICRDGNLKFNKRNAAERFRNIRLVEELDTYDSSSCASDKIPYLRKRSRIVEIVAAKNIVFALAHLGVCAAFNRDTNKRICYLNNSPDEVIRSLFYNKNNDSLITVSVYGKDQFSSLKCHSTPLEYIRRGRPDAGFALFESEALCWPGFVEFDDVNGKVLTYSAESGLYKMFCLKNYSLQYTIRDVGIQEIKISPGIMLLIFERAASHIPMKVLSIETGEVLLELNHLLHRNRKVDFIEQFNEKLLVKQDKENLQILDVRTSELVEVSKADFATPSAFIFLYENQLFLTFKNRTVAVWNFKGELVTSFEDHVLWYPDCNTNNIYITTEQDLIISYCKSVKGGTSSSDVDNLSDGEEYGTINISDILTGKCVAKIQAKDDDYSREGLKVQSALEDVTSLYYCEERNEIYTGNRRGFVHVWSN
eukprot:jgi/Mesvir1/15996/Mv08301-RA.1